MNTKRQLPYHLAFLGLNLATTGLHAQTAGAPAPSGARQMPAMVVTADAPLSYQTTTSSVLFGDTPIIETPFSVSVFNEELIEDQRAFTLAEVLENDPSVALQMPGGFYGNQNFGVRGFAVDNFNGYKIDGLTMVNSITPALDDKARVEVLKGPSALRYGFMPPGGSINLVRKRPTPEMSTSLQLEVDTFGKLYSQADIGDTAKLGSGTLGYRVVLAGDEFDSYYDYADGNRVFGSLFTEWKPLENLNVWLSLSGSDGERPGYYGPVISATGSVLDAGRDTNIMQPWAHNNQQVFDAAAGIDLTINEDWKLRTAINWQETQRNGAITYPEAIQNNGDFDDVAFLHDSEWEAWSTNLILDGKFKTGAIGHELVTGYEFRSLDTYSTREYVSLGPNNVFNRIFYPQPIPAGAQRIIDSGYIEHGAFLTDTVEFNDYLSVLLGGRFGRYENTFPTDPFSDDSVNAWSPTAAIMVEPMKNVHTYVSYTKGIQDGGYANRTAANAWEPLGVQRSEQFEAGVKSEWFGGRLAGELAIFQIEQDLAVIDTATNIDGFNGLQRHRGVEGNVRGRITEEWQAGLAAMLLDAEQVETGDPTLDGKRPQYVPQYQVNLWSVLDIPQVPGLALTGGVRFTGRQYLDQAEAFATDSYFVAGLGARYRFEAADAKWTVRLNVENVLNEKYYESGEFYPGDAGYLSYGAPVSANLSLQVEF